MGKMHNGRQHSYGAFLCSLIPIAYKAMGHQNLYTRLCLVLKKFERKKIKRKSEMKKIK